MLVAVVLGNRINDDGSMSKIMLDRLTMTLRICKHFAVDKIILSGGIANKNVNMSEARMMYDYLVERGVAEDILVMEDKSLTTKQNAELSVPIAAKLGATRLLLLTSAEHMSRSYLNPVKLFKKQLIKYPQISLLAYCED